VARSNSRFAPIAAAIFLVAACSTTPTATGAGGLPSSIPTGGGATAGVSARPSAGTSASSPPSLTSPVSGGAAGKVPTHVCDLLSSADITGVTGGSVARMEPFVHETFPQCVWHLKDATKVGTAVTSVLVAFAPTVIFDHNGTAGRVDVSGVGDVGYAYPPGQGALKSSGGELWVKTHGLILRIYTVPVDFEILKDSAKTQAWTSQSLALNEAIAKAVIAKLAAA
jgi:hypothetical protein